MRWTENDVKKHQERIAAGRRKTEKPKEAKREVQRFKSWVEAKMSTILFWRKKTGEIVKYVYESHTFTLAAKTSYKPDFIIFHNDGSVEVVETKGDRMHKDSAIRFKMAAERYTDLIWTMIQYRKATKDWIIKKQFHKAEGGWLKNN
jgi:hypothetical protein